MPNQTRFATLLVAVTLLIAACETNPLAPSWIPGPAAPPVSTARPRMWDSASELAGWINAASQGAFSIEGEDVAAFLRVTTTSSREKQEIVLRGPDLIPPALALRGVRLRYRWTVNGGSSTEMSGRLGAVQPVEPAWPPAILTGRLNLRSTEQPYSEETLGVEGWASDQSQSGELCGGPCPGDGGVVDARYVYLHLQLYRPEVVSRLDIDWIALVF